MTFTHHRPWLMQKDLAFFSEAQKPPFNLIVHKVMSKVMWPMYPTDPGSVEIRQQVHFYTLRKK
jgi:nicotinamide N-methyltransferase